MNYQYGIKHRKPYPVALGTPLSSSIENDFKKKRVRKSFIGGYHISTVFLEYNCGIYQEEPVLFETMIFHKNENNTLKDYCTRCSTHRQALYMHRHAKSLVKEKIRGARNERA